MLYIYANYLMIPCYSVLYIQSGGGGDLQAFVGLPRLPDPGVTDLAPVLPGMANTGAVGVIG